MLTNEQIETFRLKLVAARADIEGQLGHIGDDVSFGEDKEDDEEGTDEAEEVANRTSIRTALEDQYSRLTKALQKIEAGTYGACEQCGGPIEIEILSVDPESTFCRNCKRGTRDAS